MFNHNIKLTFQHITNSSESFCILVIFYIFYMYSENIHFLYLVQCSNKLFNLKTYFSGGLLANKNTVFWDVSNNAATRLPAKSTEANADKGFCSRTQHTDPAAKCFHKRFSIYKLSVATRWLQNISIIMFFTCIEK